MNTALSNPQPSPRRFSTRQTISLLAAGICVTAISACDSTGLNTTEATNARLDAPGVSASLDLPALMNRAAAATSNTSPVTYLVNGSFEQGTSGWQSCSPNPPLKLVNDATDGSNALLVKKRNCVQQGVSVNPGEALILSCDVKMNSNRNDWTGLGLSFFDEYWNYVSEPAPVLINGDSYNTYSVAGNVPAGARNAAVWLYTENQVILDKCTLQKTIEPPPPPPLYGNLLVNAEFVDGGETATGWSDRCNGNYQRTNSFDGAIAVGGGACVHHRPDNDALAALQGNYFAYSCEYTKSEGSYASIATNLTTRRDETGQNDVAILPRTYFGGTPSWQFETVTLYGKAKDYLEPGNIFVSIGDQGSDGLLVLGCSLEVVSGQTYSIGDTGPAGGIVFSLSEDRMHGLEAAPTDVADGGGIWCSENADIEGMDNIPDATTPDPRSGSYNTDRINYRCGAGTVASKTRSYVWPNGQTDGYLPNKDELYELYLQRNLVGGFSSEPGVYASSTEDESLGESFNMYGVSFFVDNAVLLDWRKTSFAKGRAIRSF